MTESRRPPSNTSSPRRPQGAAPRQPSQEAGARQPPQGAGSRQPQDAGSRQPPQETASGESPQDATSTQPPQSGAPRQPPRSLGTVLVVDDSEIARTTLKNALTLAGMKVIALPSPIGATRAIMNHDICVVVIDLMMPGMRGDRLTALFRQNPRFHTLGVVLVSGENEAEMQRLASEVGADAAVSKSNISELVAAVRRAYLKRAVHA